nr:MAG TPA: hypothetical protein [Caudoviricetes sp.]
MLNWDQVFVSNRICNVFSRELVDILLDFLKSFCFVYAWSRKIVWIR